MWPNISKKKNNLEKNKLKSTNQSKNKLNLVKNIISLECKITFYYTTHIIYTINTLLTIINNIFYGRKLLYLNIFKIQNTL